MLLIDNYYNIVDRNETLLNHKLGSCGTIRINHELPCELKSNKLQCVILQTWHSKSEDDLEYSFE